MRKYDFLKTDIIVETKKVTFYYRNYNWTSITIIKIIIFVDFRFSLLLIKYVYKRNQTNLKKVEHKIFATLAPSVNIFTS